MANSVIKKDQVETILKDNMPSREVLDALMFHNRIREQLKRDMGVSLEDSFLSGSYARFTNVVHTSKSKSKKNEKTGSDVDIDIVVNFSCDASPIAVLNSVASFVNKTMQALGNKYTICIQNRSIGVEVTVNGLQAHFDIVPLKRKENYYLICWGEGVEAWIATNPKAAITHTLDACKDRPQLRPLIRLMKIWNYTFGTQRPFKSFHLECLVIWICVKQGLIKNNNEEKEWDTLIPLCFVLLSLHYANQAVLAPGSGATLCAYLLNDIERNNFALLALSQAVENAKKPTWPSLFGHNTAQ